MRCAPPNAVYGIETLGATGNRARSRKVVRRLMPFTALKPTSIVASSNTNISGCAPPNAVYGIETNHFGYVFGEANSVEVVRRLMPFTALKP